MINIISLTKGSQKPSLNPDPERRVMPVPIDRFNGSVLHSQQDLLAVEEPLQIRLNYRVNGMRTEKDVAITMRTPGHDVDLAAGFLFSEGILEDSHQILRVRQACKVSKNKVSAIV